MENNDATNPIAEAPEAEAPEVEMEADEPSAEVETDEDGNPVEAEADADAEEFIEIEKDGKTYKVPKSVEDLLMFQKDYTQKTQTLAEQRRELESQRQATQWEEQTRRELFNEEAQLFNVRSRLDQFQQVNWQALAQQDASQYAALHAEYTQLKDYHDGLSNQVENRKGQLAAAREQATAISVERAIQTLNTPDPATGWDGKFDADKSRKLTDFLVQKGANPEVLRTILDPLSIKIINLAMIGDEALRKQSASLKPTTPTAKPVPQVATGKTRTGPVNPDKLSNEDWLKWREGQLKKKQNAR